LEAEAEACRVFDQDELDGLTIYDQLFATAKSRLDVCEGFQYLFWVTFRKDSLYGRECRRTILEVI
jgi:hypothetical protein